MKRLLSAVLTVCLAVTVGVSIGASVSESAPRDTGCWDEYTLTGGRPLRVITPVGVDLGECTAAVGCLSSYRAGAGAASRRLVPHGAAPSACDDESATTTPTTPPPATSSPTTVPPTTAPSAGSAFLTLPVGAVLPTGHECASRVRSMTENRPENASANGVRGTKANERYPHADGDFTGTTDEILQWVACKWGIAEDIVRAQVVAESNWQQDALGDFTSDAGACIPTFGIGTYPPQYNGDRTHVGECPESIGLGQVRWLYHQEAFAARNSVRSSAYNVDYTYAVWRSCFEGEMTWLNDVERGRRYSSGDAEGCLGVWFSGRWYTGSAKDYIERVEQILSDRTWDQDGFPKATPD